MQMQQVAVSNPLNRSSERIGKGTNLAALDKAFPQLWKGPDLLVCEAMKNMDHKARQRGAHFETFQYLELAWASILAQSIRYRSHV